MNIAIEPQPLYLLIDMITRYYEYENDDMYI